MKKQLLLMLSLSCVAYNFGMEKFAANLMKKGEAAALETVKKIEDHQIELIDFTLRDIATAEVSVNGNKTPLTFVCLEQGKVKLLEGLLNHVDKPSALKGKNGSSLVMQIFNKMHFALFFTLATKDKDCLLAKDENSYFPLVAASALASSTIVEAILAKAREHNNLDKVLNLRSKFGLNTLQHLDVVKKHPEREPAESKNIVFFDGKNFSVAVVSRKDSREKREEIRKLILKAHYEVLGLD